MIGAAMAANQTLQSKNTTTHTSQKAENKKAAADNKEDEKDENQLYGTILKVDKEKMELESAEVIWEKDGMEEEKTGLQKKTDTAKKDSTAEKTEMEADFETEEMKWNRGYEYHAGICDGTNK